jgi:hypothetical protein
MKGMEKVYTAEDRKAYASYLASEMEKLKKQETKNSKEEMIKHYNYGRLEEDRFHTMSEVLAMTSKKHKR